MISKKSVVSIGLQNQQNLTPLGKLTEYNFYSPTGNGQLMVVVEPFNEELDKNTASLLTEKIGELVVISITGGPADETHSVFLCGVEASASNFDGRYLFDRLLIRANHP